MKKLPLFLFVMFVGTVFGQNPDGKNVSLHLTPLWMWGSSNFQRVTSVWYPPTQASEAQSVTSTNYGIVNYPYAFGVATQVKIPATANLTLTLGYSYNQKFEEDDRNYKQGNYFSDYNSINGKYQTFSATFSFYNLFSLYLGDD